MASEVLDEAYVRLHRWGPECGGENGLSNHGPMAAEVLSRRGFDDQVGSWPSSFAATWAACAAITVAYAPADPRPILTAPASEPGPAPDAADLMARATEHGDEHVIKLTDTALDAYARTADPALLTAASRCADLIDPPR